MLRLLGTASYDHKPVTLERSLYIVALLICQNTWMSREELTLLLWTEDDTGSMVKQRLRQLLYRTKQMPYATGIEVSHSQVRYTAPNDVQLFRTAIQQRNWTEAIQLYQGEFLCDAVVDHAELEEWFALERATLSAGFRLAVLEQAAHLPALEAALLLEQAMTHDPLNEELLKTLLGYASQYPEVGVRAYAQFEQHLTQKLQLEPPKELQALVKTLPEAKTVIVNPVAFKLPTPSNAFVGRQAELDQIALRLKDPHFRLLSLVGVGGIGKTRLSLEVAIRSGEECVFVDLARLSDHELVPHAILEALGESPTENPMIHLKDVLTNKKLLLVLDNFEHVMPARQVVADLLENTTMTKFVVTSRESLGLAREQVFELQGLPAPDTMFPLETQDAAQIFLRAAQHSQLDFTFDHDFAAFNRIYKAVQGTPLGLELAASWVRTLSLDQIASELEQSLDVLSVDAPDMPERHRSFAAVFTSSWMLLNKAEQTALAQLSIFQGGFDKDMAMTVTGANLTLLLRLVNKSLISRRDQRFVMHEMIRQYSQQKRSPENHQQALVALGKVALNLSEKWYEHRNGEMISEWSKRLEQDHDNIRTALSWALEHDILTGTLICGHLEHFWYIRGHHREGLNWALQFEAHYPHPDHNRVRLLWTIISLSKELGAYDLSKATLETYRNMATKLNDRRLISNYEKLVGFIAHEQGDLDLAKLHLENSLQLHIEFDNHYSIATCHNSLGIIAAKQGRYQEAKQHAEEALRLKRMIGDKHGISYALENLGVIAGQQGDYALEKIMIEEALRLNKELGDQQGIAKSIHALGKNALEQNQIQEALDHCFEAFEICCRIERRYLMIQVIHTFAIIAKQLGQVNNALHFMMMCINLTYQLRSLPPKVWFDEQKQIQNASDLTPAQQAQLEFETQQLDLQQVMQLVYTWKTNLVYRPSNQLLVLQT